MLKKAKKPTTSVTVVTNAPDAKAGSIPNFSRITGIVVPARFATTRFINMDMAMTTPSIAVPNQNTPIKPIETAKIKPVRMPTPTSRRITRPIFVLEISFVAIARTATVKL